MGLHTLGSYSGKVVLDGDSCIPLGLFSASQPTRHAMGMLTAMAALCGAGRRGSSCL
jgi:hypothetical protein